MIGLDGQPILRNKIFRTPAGTEDGGDEGQLAIDMSPTQPHTATKEARTWESCHLSNKALGYGLGGVKMTRPPDQALVVDLETADQQVLPHRTRPQAEPIESLAYDWSQVVTEDGKQLQTVGHHFRLDRPLNSQERANMDRRGVCLGCHREISDRSLAVSLLHHMAEYSGQLPETRDEHTALTHKIPALLRLGPSSTGGNSAVGVSLAIVWLLRRRWRQDTKPCPDVVS